MTTTGLESQIREAMIADDWHAVGLLGGLLDAIETAERPAEVGLLSAALWYAEQALQVFPLSPGTKIPLPGSAGFKDGTTDPGRIRAWWARTPEANVGVATGHLVDVIDIDGPEGVLSWARSGDLPPTLGTVSTPRPGGTHLYLPATGDGNAAQIQPGVDYRGLGGYVLVPPSVITAGPHPGRYRWRKPLDLNIHPLLATRSEDS